MNEINIEGNTFTEVRQFAGGGGPGGGNKPKYSSSKKYLFETRLQEVLNDLIYTGYATRKQKNGNSYGLELMNGSMIIIYITSDGMYVVTKINSATGGYAGAMDVSTPNALICGPGIIDKAIRFVDKNVKDTPKSILRKIYDHFFGPSRFSDIKVSIDVRQFAGGGGGGGKPNPPKPPKPNPKPNPPKSAHKTIFELDLINHLNQLQSKDEVIDYKKLGESYAVRVTRDRAIIVYITDEGDFILSKLNKETGGYVGAKPNQLNAIITGSRNFNQAFRTMLYKVADREGWMHRIVDTYFPPKSL